MARKRRAEKVEVGNLEPQAHELTPDQAEAVRGGGINDSGIKALVILNSATASAASQETTRSK